VAGLEHYLQQRDNGSPTQSRRNELLQLDSMALKRKSSHFLTFPQQFFLKLLIQQPPTSLQEKHLI
jgi:hypothetical protein